MSPNWIWTRSLPQVVERGVHVSPLPRYPSIARDISDCFADDTLPASIKFVARSVSAAPANLVVDAGVLDSVLAQSACRMAGSACRFA